MFPRRRTSNEAETSDGGGGGGFGGFLGGLGRTLKAATEGVGGLLNDCGIGNPARPAGGKGEGAWTTEWMKMCAPALADLKLADMSLPGTHDSGTAEMVRAEGGVLIIMHGCSRTTLNPRIPTRSGRSTSDFHRPGRENCVV